MERYDEHRKKASEFRLTHPDDREPERREVAVSARTASFTGRVDKKRKNAGEVTYILSVNIINAGPSHMVKEDPFGTFIDSYASTCLLHEALKEIVQKPIGDWWSGHSDAPLSE